MEDKETNTIKQYHSKIKEAISPFTDGHFF